MLNALVASVHRRQLDPDAPIPARARGGMAPRLLELMRTEVIGAWAGNDIDHVQAMCNVLTAIESVRSAIERDWLGEFIGDLSGSEGREMLVAIAHDLRSPLTSILFLADTLRRGQSGPVNEVQQRQLALVYGAAMGLNAVASDIIAVARGGEGLVEKERVAFSVAGVLESVRDIVQPIAEEKGLAVGLVPPTHDQRLGHPVALSRVLLNLTTNALKFTEAGSVEISAREGEGTRVEFAVRDTGKGIAPEILDHLYQPLRRLQGRSEPSFSHTGLGLLMCRKLVALMGAELRVETRVGQGTRFHFELELPPCADTKVSPGRPNSKGRGGIPRRGPTR